MWDFNFGTWISHRGFTVAFGHGHPLVDMVGFVDPHKVVARRSAFLAFPNAQNGGESIGGVESERLKH